MRDIVPLGILVILIGFVIVVAGVLFNPASQRAESKFAVGGIFGFIPFGFGNDKKLVVAMAAITVFLFVIWLILTRQ